MSWRMGGACAGSLLLKLFDYYAEVSIDASESRDVSRYWGFLLKLDIGV